MRYTLLRTFRFLLFLSFGVLVAGCQHPSASSSQQETERIDSLLDANKVVLFSDPAALNARLVQWQREVHDSVNWYKIETYRASALYRQGDTLQSQSLYRQVLDWCANRSDCKELTADVWNHQALHADQEGKVATALHCAGRAFRLLDGLPHKTDKLVRICINLADIHYRSGQIAEAARYFRRAQLLSDSLHYDALNSSIYTGLGQVSMELYDFKAAHRHFAQAARYLPDDDLFDFFFHYNTVGNCYYFEGRYREALVPFRKALAYAQQMENDCNQAIAYSNQAEIYLMLDSIPQASRMLRLAMKHYERSGQCPPNALHYMQSLRADLALAEGNIAKARRLLEQYPARLFQHSPRYLMLHFQRLERYAARAGRWQWAYHFSEEREKYSHILQNQQTRNVVGELALRYSRDTTLIRQQLKLADLETRSVRQQNYILLAVFAVVIVLLVSVVLFVWMRKRANDRQRKQVECINELRMDIVRNRVSPHYIFNVLGTILPRLQRYSELTLPVDMLIDVLRGNLLASDKVAVALRNELQLVENFVKLHHFSKGDDPKVEWVVDDDLRDSVLQIPSMSLQIPVENALKHAFPERHASNCIRIEVTHSEGVLTLRVTDNGAGYNPGSIKPNGRDTGTGLRLLSRTIEILNQYNARQATFSITNLLTPLHGTCMELRLPEDYRYLTSSQTR